MNHLSELKKCVFVYTIPYKDVENLFISYCEKVLLSDNALHFLGINPTIHRVCKFLVQQAKNYMQNEISGIELKRMRKLCCDLMDSVEKGCKEWALLDVVDNFLYEDLDCYWDPEMGFITFYDALIGLDQNQQFCKRLTDYIITEYYNNTKFYPLLKESNYENINAFLKKYGFDSADEDGRTFLMFAIITGKDHVVNYLVNEGCDVNIKDRYGLTALHYAAFYDNYNIVKFLVIRGAEIDAVNNIGSTPLWMAVKAVMNDGNPTLTIKYLLENGADPDKKNNHGVTPNDLLRKRLEKMGEKAETQPDGKAKKQ